MCWWKKNCTFCQTFRSQSIDSDEMEIELSKLINNTSETVMHTSRCVSTVWIFDSLRIQIKSNTQSIHFCCGKWERYGFFGLQLLLSSSPKESPFYLNCHWVLDFVLSSSKMCAVHSTELTLLKCSEFQTSCILMFAFGSHRRFHSLIYQTDCTRSWCWSDINGWTALTNAQFASCILLFIPSKWWIFAAENTFDHNCDTQPFLVWSCALHVHRRHRSSVYVWFPFFAFVPFTCTYVCIPYEHTTEKQGCEAKPTFSFAQSFVSVYFRWLYIVYVSIATNHSRIKAIFLNFFIFSRNTDPWVRR